MSAGMVESVMIDGQWRLKERAVVGLNVDRLFGEARKAAAQLWKKMS
jgi:hypothetical protein